MLSKTARGLRRAQIFAVGVVVGLAVLTAAVLVYGGTTDRRKDIIFVGPLPHCLGDVVECAESIHFNGDWTGVKLCRATTCVNYEEIFTDEKRNGAAGSGSPRSTERPRSDGRRP